jgi:Cu/Ag efflux protein CusF
MKTLVLTLSLALLAPLAVASETPPRHDGHHAAQTQPDARTALATGTVKRIDPQQGTITIAHAPVPSLRWPAMVMPFNASAEQMAQVAVGDEISFEFSSSAEAAELISIGRQ